MSRLLPALALAALLTACIPPAAQQTPSPVASSQASQRGPGVEGDIGSAPTASGSTAINERLLPSGILELGNPTAPVSLLLFTNHSCAYCRVFHDQLIPRLNTDYIRSGKVRVGIVPFALQKYASSNESASALLCAARQGKGAAMHALLFRTSPSARTFATDLGSIGVDSAQFNACIGEEGIRATLSAQQSFAHTLGVELLPAYFINGQMYIGQPDYADLRGQIEDADGE